MPGTHVKTVTVNPVNDSYGWSIVDNDTQTTPNWVSVVQQGSSDNWDFIVVDNTGSARSAIATVTHSNGVTTDSFQIDQAGVTQTNLPSQIPVLTTNAPTNVNSNGLQANATITTANGTITSKGFLWGTDQNNLTGDVSPTGVNFSANILSLNPNTPYYIQAYAVNGYGTGYGNIVAVTTSQPAAQYDSINGTLNPSGENEMDLTFTVNTTGIAQGVIPTYELVPVSSGFNSDDIVGGALSGSMSPIDANGQSSVTIQYRADETQEGDETYNFTVTGDNSGNNYNGQFPILSNRTISDTSTGTPRWTGATLKFSNPNSVSNIANSTGIDEGFAYHAVLEGESQPGGTTIYWEIDSTGYSGVLGQQAGATAGDFTSGMLGSFVTGAAPLNDPNKGSFEINTLADANTEVKEGFTVRFYSDTQMQNPITGSNGLPIEINTMSLNDTSQSPSANFAWASVDVNNNYTPQPVYDDAVPAGGVTYGLVHFVSDVAPTLSDFTITGANGAPSNPNPNPPAQNPSFFNLINGQTPPPLSYNSTTNEGVLRFAMSAIPSGTNTRFAQITTSLTMQTHSNPNISYSDTATIYQTDFINIPETSETTSPGTS